MGSPLKFIKWTPRSAAAMPGEMQVTITLKKVSCGTGLSILQEGVPGVIPAEACYLGWQQSLALLAMLVEAETTG
jgi:Activator of Hsp90 ATPase homolog 1-like protein